MGYAQKHDICINVPSSQILDPKEYLNPAAITSFQVLYNSSAILPFDASGLHDTAT
jgi:hypothetical protein